MELYLKVRLACRDGMSAREAARQFGISRESVKKMLSFSVPPGYRRTAPIKRPKLGGFTEIIDQWLRDDVGQHRKQRHTAKRVFDPNSGSWSRIASPYGVSVRLLRAGSGRL